MSENLLACPFCGGTAERIDVPDCEDEGENAGGSCIQCTRCTASTALHFDRKENLYSSWNERHTSEMIEALDVANNAFSELKAAFGAPGDHGYETREGRALFAAYKAWAGARSALSRARGKA